MQPGHSVKGREEWIIAVRFSIHLLIKYFVGKREGRSGLTSQRPRPIHHNLKSIGKTGNLQLPNQHNVGRVVADKLRQVLSRNYSGPRLGAGAISRIKEITGLQPAPTGLPRVWNACLHRLPPKVYMRMELLMNLCATLRIIKQLIHS